MKNVFLLFITSVFSASIFAACPTDSSDVGSVEATVVGIEVQSHCTFLLLDNVNSTLSSHDSGPFGAGRFKYLAIDPENPNYNSIITLASMAFATQTRVYAQVTSRLARVNRFSLSKSENNNP